MQYAARTCPLPSAFRPPSSVFCPPSRFTPHVSRFTLPCSPAPLRPCIPSRFTPHVSRLTFHLSRFTPHASCPPQADFACGSIPCLLPAAFCLLSFTFHASRSPAPLPPRPLSRFTLHVSRFLSATGGFRLRLNLLPPASCLLPTGSPHSAVRIPKSPIGKFRNPHSAIRN